MGALEPVWLAQMVWVLSVSWVAPYGDACHQGLTEHPLSDPEV